jgi:hypothetical protein
MSEPPTSGARSTQVSNHWPEFPRVPARLGEPGWDAELQAMWHDFRAQLDRIAVGERSLIVTGTGGGGSGGGTGSRDGAWYLDVESELRTVKLMQARLGDAEAMIRRIDEIQITENTALARATVELTAKVGQNQARIFQKLQTYSTREYAEALKEEAISAAVGESVASFTETLTAYATEEYAQTMKTEAISAAVGDAEASFTSTLTAYASKTYAETKKTEAISAAAGDATAKVSAEAGVRATKDGYMHGHYLLNVTAGNKVAGMKLSADSDPSGWGSQSAIEFLADSFKISTGSSAGQAVSPFSLSGGVLELNAQLVINGQSLQELQENAAVPPLNYVGAFSSEPSAAGYAVNSVYKNTTNGNSYIRTSVATWALYMAAAQAGEQGPQGDTGPSGTHVDYVFKRSASAPSTPTGSTPSGWSDGPPTGTDPLYLSRATKSYDDVLIGTWSTPVKIDGDSLIMEYSADGSTNWHSTFSAGDLFARSKIGLNGTFTSAFRIVGETGNFTDYRFKRATSAPATPTGASPAGWVDAPPAGTDPLYFSKAEKTAAGAVVGSWSAPARMDGDGVSFEYSINGSTLWHSTFTTGDIYMRQKVGVGAWSAAIRIVGEQGAPGLDGSDGIDGAPGTSSYFHVAYADSADGSVNFNQTSGLYIGTYVNGTQADSNNPNAYTWRLFKGADGQDGEDGIPGVNGADGQTSYLHIKYSDNGTTFTANNGETVGAWLGTKVDFVQADSSVFSDYAWKKIEGAKGIDGLNGIDGADGRDGVDGADGTSTFFHVAYADSANGGVNFNQVAGTYIGTYVDQTQADSNNPAAYTWRLFKGADGENGLPGLNGADGRTSYLHIKYSDNGVSFTANNGETAGAYIGSYVDFTEADSGVFGSYKWKKIQGENGLNGVDGVDGADGTSSFFHVAYADSANGGVNFNQVAGTYIGTYVDNVLADSTNPLRYTWRLFKGADGQDGEDGIPGTNGIDGRTQYLHIKYSDNGSSFTANNGETVGSWIGTLVDFVQADSSVFGDYTWKKVVGSDGTSGGYTDYIFKRSATAPATPTGTVPAGWVDAPPAGTDPLYMSKAAKTAAGALIGAWSAPAKLDGDKGATGSTGATGAAGDSITVAYSTDGANNWHTPFVTGDLYMRQRVGVGAWSGAMRIVGEKGTTGDAGSRGSKSFFGTTPSNVWDTNYAEAAVAASGLTKVLLDQVTLQNTALHYAETRFWSGSQWTTMEQVIHGSLLVDGTVGTQHLVASISLRTPKVLGGVINLNGACTVCSDTSDGADTSIIRLNGGGADGPTRGGQIDLLGNEYSGAAASGSILLTPGAVAGAFLKLRDRAQNDRITINSDGLVVVSGTSIFTEAAYFQNIISVTGGVGSKIQSSTDDLYLGSWGTAKARFSNDYYLRFNNGIVDTLYGIDTGTNRGVFGTATNHTLVIKTNGQERWFFGSDGNLKGAAGADIRKVTNDGWSLPLSDGSNSMEFGWNGSSLLLRINGSLVRTVYTY